MSTREPHWRAWPGLAADVFAVWQQAGRCETVWQQARRCETALMLCGGARGETALMLCGGARAAQARSTLSAGLHNVPQGTPQPYASRPHVPLTVGIANVGRTFGTHYR